MEELKFIVGELNKRFDGDYNMISFDSLSVTELLQVLADVLHLIDATGKIDVSKNRDQALMNIMTALQTVKYEPENNIAAADFREGLIVGKRQIIHPILHWVLLNFDKVKRRVYFATFVEKVNIPEEILSDPEVEQINMNYEKLIDEFWGAYNDNKKEKKNSDESTELQDDTKKMAADMSFLLQRLDIQNDKLKNIPNRENLLTSVKAYRRELQQEKKLQGQLKDHRNILTQSSGTIKTLQNTLSHKASRRPENLNPVQQIAEELQINKILDESQLPREQSEILGDLGVFERVAVDAEPTQDELDRINTNMEQVNEVVQNLLSKKMTLTNTNDDQLLPFRNQAVMIANKKQELSNFIMKIKSKNDSVLELVGEKNMTLRQIVGGEILHGEDLKLFISNLRERSGVYKKYRAYLQGLQAELGVITRTMEILKIGQDSLDSVIKMKKSNPQQLDDVSIDNVAELKYKCKALFQEANALRVDTARIYEEMVQMRAAFTSFNDKFEETKTEFDIATGNMSEELANFEKLNEETVERVKKGEDEWKALFKEVESFEVCLLKYGEELGSAAGMALVFGKLNERLQEAERARRELERAQDRIKQRRNMEQDELEQLKRIKQMVLYKIEGA